MKKLSLLIATALIAVMAMAAVPASSDAHGWHYTKCRWNVRWVRGHQGVNWYRVGTGCGGNWEAWEWYSLSAPVWKSAQR